MGKLQRLAAVGALTAVAVALGGCGDDDDDDDVIDDAQSVAPDATDVVPDPLEDDVLGGVTSVEDIFGPECQQLPAAGPGSVQSAADLPAADAIASLPVLSTLSEALESGGMVAVLNDTDSGYTVFAPANSAFEQLPEGMAADLTAAPDAAQPDSELNRTLNYHVVSERHDAEGIVENSPLTTVQGGTVEVSGTADAPIVNGANVLCGNIPTENATVFIVDEVLSPPAG